MSDSDNELQSKMDEFISQHGSKPSATQLSKFAGVKYSQASAFLRGVKSSSKPTTSSRLPQKIKWIPADPQTEAQTKKTRPSSKSVTTAIPTTQTTVKKTKPRSYSNTKKRPCNRYQLDMTGAEFGACKCGFSRAAHYDTSAFRDDSDEEEEEEEEEEQGYEQVDQPVVQQEETKQEQEQYEYRERVEETEKEQPVFVDVEKEYDENKVSELQNVIDKLQQQVISMQQEINKAYQEKESLRKEREDERNELLKTISEQRTQISALQQENDQLKGNAYKEPVQNVFDEPVQNVYNNEQDDELFQEEPQQEEPQGACNNYVLDMTGAEFGSCKCGFPKAAHFGSNVNRF